MVAVAINVRRFFHGFALRAAVLAGSGDARTNGMSAFLGIFRGHFVLLFADGERNIRAAMVAGGTK
jgi:hypothetical protein